MITPLRMNWAPCLHTCAESQTFDARVTVPVVLTPAAADPRLMVTPVCMGSQMVGTGSGMYPVYWLQWADWAYDHVLTGQGTHMLFEE